MLSLRIPHLLLLLLLFLRRCSADKEADCNSLSLTFEQKYKTFFNSDFTLRKVELEGGQDTLECLNLNKTTNPPPCASLQYALHGSDENFLTDLVFHLGPGSYRAHSMATRIINAQRLAFIGAGISQTKVMCGAHNNLNPCSFLNFQIRNSSHVFISDITFTGCGPVTSPVYIGSSDFVFIDKCSFE